MNDIPESSDNGTISATDLRFAMLRTDQIDPPRDLFDERVVIDQLDTTIFLPLIVHETTPGRFAIIDGCKRFMRMKSTGHRSCSCGIITPGLTEEAAGLLRIRLNRGRALHLREKLLFLRWIKKFTIADPCPDAHQELRLAPGECHTLEGLLPLSDRIIEAVVQGHLDPTVAPEIAHLDSADTDALLGLFATLSFSRQMQRELAEWLHEIAFIGRTTITDLLRGPDIAAILGSPKLNAPQKVAHLHEQVFNRRFPLYAKAKKAWAEHARKVNPDPARVVFQPSPSFEKAVVELKIRITDPHTASSLMQALSSISPEEWEVLVDPTRALDRHVGG